MVDRVWNLWIRLERRLSDHQIPSGWILIYGSSPPTPARMLAQRPGKAHMTVVHHPSNRVTEYAATITKGQPVFLLVLP